MALITEFRRTILPPKLKNLFPQEFNLFVTCSNRGSQVDKLLGFAPIGRPKYLKGKLVSLQPKKLHAISIKSLRTLIPIKPLLRKFTFKPEPFGNLAAKLSKSKDYPPSPYQNKLYRPHIVGEI